MASNDAREIEPRVEDDAAAMETCLRIKKQKRTSGIVSRLWRRIFRMGREDFEKRLEYLSKEEANVHSRLKRRNRTLRQMIRNLIVSLVVLEVIAIFHATTRSADMSWQQRALRVLPMFLLPGLSSVIYTALVSLTRMLEHKDQKKLESLRAERKAKIDELKEQTNYYATQQLIQKYDLDPAAKAAAATVLASKLGTDSGLKVNVVKKTEATPKLPESNVDPIHSNEPRNGSSNAIGSDVTSQLVPESSPNFTEAGLALPPGPNVVEHYTGSISSDGSWIARLAAFLVGDDPSQCFALICGNCHKHNGLARKEDFYRITYYCPHCNAMNTSQQKLENDMNSHARDTSTGSEITKSSTTAVKELPELPNDDENRSTEAS